MMLRIVTLGIAAGFLAMFLACGGSDRPRSATFRESTPAPQVPPPQVASTNESAPVESAPAVEPSAPQQPKMGSYSAMSIAKEAVKKTLKAPSTAEFPSLTWSTGNKLTTDSDGRIWIESYVDSQNGFGAQIRTEWSAVLQPLSSTQANILFLQVGETIVVDKMSALLAEKQRELEVARLAAKRAEAEAKAKAERERLAKIDLEQARPALNDVIASIDPPTTAKDIDAARQKLEAVVEAYPGTGSAEQADDESSALGSLRTVFLYLNAGSKDKAADKLRDVIERKPGTIAAKAAEKLLADLQ
ncbi:hypothetical protein [Stratiformator vulcanicus]|uniref:Tetratricopeptide repeat protein n=1 Tax=Stratiformator vulcanicus TaxID=2527980 RepID=A0A517R754_9PLAN|nr:hypothetical protein [Stratiformator vulcanicus]QDT39718.1 hypothetical protein Pan189_41270 [Stratiformator vulcanicus]